MWNAISLANDFDKIERPIVGQGRTINILYQLTGIHGRTMRRYMKRGPARAITSSSLEIQYKKTRRADGQKKFE